MSAAATRQQAALGRFSDTLSAPPANQIAAIQHLDVDDATSVLDYCAWLEALHQAISQLLRDPKSDRVVSRRLAELGAYVGTQAVYWAGDLRDKVAAVSAEQESAEVHHGR